MFVAKFGWTFWPFSSRNPTFSCVAPSHCSELFVRTFVWHCHSESFLLVPDYFVLVRKAWQPVSVSPTILSEMFTRQISQNLKSVKVKITASNGKSPVFIVGHSDGRLGKQVTTCNRHTKTLVGTFGKMIKKKQIREEFEVGNGKNYLHPRKSPAFFSRSEKIWSEW